MNRHHHGQLAPRRAGASNARARALPLALPSESVRAAGRAVGSLLLAAVLGACGDVGIPEPLSSEAKSLESGETGRCQPGLLEFEELVIGRSSFGELASNAVLDVAVHPTSGRIIVAARNGISTSTDGGRTWRTAPARVRGLQRASLAMEGDLIVSPTQQLSRDGGDTWENVEPSHELGTWESVAIGAGALYATRAEAPLMRSTDGGKTFSVVPAAARTAWDVVASGSYVATLQAARDEGGYLAYLEISRDAGQSFTAV